MNFDYSMNQIPYGAVQLTKNANSLYMHMQKWKIQEALSLLIKRNPSARAQREIKPSY